MIKINYPPKPAKIYIKYGGSRLNLMQQHSQFINSKIWLEKTYGNIKESITVEVKLFDDIVYHLGLISRSIYSEINNEFVKFENGFLIHHNIILSNNLSFISGIITMDIELNGEFITERYFFKVFINNSKKINEYIMNSGIDCENFE